VLEHTGFVESRPLRIQEFPDPQPGPGEVRIRVSVCAICRTDLHVIEGELERETLPVIPGHQVVGVVDQIGPGTSTAVGSRVGVAWLHSTCGQCMYCKEGRENLCDHAQFTGHTVQGGLAQYIVAKEQFVYLLPERFEDLQAAPLLCAGIIGFRCLRVSGLESGKTKRLGLYGFGAAAHVAIQVARHWGVEVYVCTRDERHRQLARELGAKWTGTAMEPPPAPLDAAILFAPAGELVPAALRAVRKGGMVTLGGIHMSPIPSMPYELLYGERVLRSVANNTREDGRDFLATAARIGLRPSVVGYRLEDVNHALFDLKNDAIRGSAVILIPPLAARREPS
jgi:alcohol dehydrogenase, propanol-preferring